MQFIETKEGVPIMITVETEVCSLHFRSEDLRKSFNSRAYVKSSGIFNTISM